MLDEEVTRLSEPYQGEVKPKEPGLLRVAGPLGLNLATSVALGPRLETQILLSDYLAACPCHTGQPGRSASRAPRTRPRRRGLRAWLSGGVTAGERSTVVPPRSPYEELATHRVQTHLARVLRAWGSALDCVRGCIIGGGPGPGAKVPSQGESRQPSTHTTAGRLQQVEAAAGPAGWRDWLLGMRNTYVHRGRRSVTWSGNLESNELVDFNLRLPIAPALTEIDGVIQAGGVMAATFTAPPPASLTS